MGKKSLYHWVNRQGNTEHEVIISARDINKGLHGIHCAAPEASKDGAGGLKSSPDISPGEHLHSRERPRESGLFLSSETTLSGYLITALKYLSRER